MSNNNLPKGVLKMTPGDFVVQEIVRSEPPRAVSFCDESIILGWDGHSAVTVFSLSKCRWSTEDAVNEVARQLGVSFRDISYHGLKDKHADTTQLIGVAGKFRPSFSHRDIRLVQLYGQNHPLRRGGHWGNRFNILIRSHATKLDLAAAEATPNLFGPQRLGREGTEQVGRLLLEGKNEEAVQLMLSNPAGESTLRRAKELSGGSWGDALSHPSFDFSFRFEIQKWQSYLWNKLLQEQMEELGENLPDRLPMWNLSAGVSDMYRHLWDPVRSQLDPRAVNALVYQERSTMIRPIDFRAVREETGWRFTFDLLPGAYATVVLSRLFDLEEGRRRDRFYRSDTALSWD